MNTAPTCRMAITSEDPALGSPGRLKPLGEHDVRQVWSYLQSLLETASSSPSKEN
jgi:hypothetical protein